MKFRKVYPRFSEPLHYIDGKLVTEEEYEQAIEADRPKVSPSSVASYGFGYEASWNKPVVSDSMGIHPKQLAKSRAVDERLGVPVEYTSDDGYSYSPVFRSRSEQLRYLKAHGFHNKHETKG